MLFIEAEIALQNAFGALDDFPGLQLFRECGVGFLEAREFKFGTYEKSDCGDHANLSPPIDMVLAVLQIDHAYDAASAKQRDREKRLIAVFRQLVKKLEARIVRRFFRNGNWLAVLRHPACNALSNAKFQAVDDVGVRVLRGAKNKFITFEDVDEAGVALDESARQIQQRDLELREIRPPSPAAR